jgi:thymidylate synthase
MNKLDLDYQALLQDILDNGVEKKDRTGTGTLSIFGWQIRHKMSEGFPLLTTKKMAWKTMVTELLWFLRGDTNIKYLVDNNCHIWDGDAWKNYCNNCNEDEWMKEIILDLPFHNKSYGLYSQEEFINRIKTDDEFAKKWGSLGKIYGAQWRSWDIKPNIETKSYIHKGETHFTFDINERQPIDQIANLISELKTNPDSRRLMVNAWNVGELSEMVLPPCHYGFQVYTRELSLEERATIWNNTHNPVGNIYTHNQYDENDIPTRAISLMWNQRSVDTFLGLPFNIASYGLLLEIIAKEVNMVPDELIGNLGDVHLYSNHIEQAKEQIGRDLTITERIDLYKKQQNISEDVTVTFNVDYNSGAHFILDEYNIPKRTREPFELPKLGKLPDYLSKKDNWECYKPEDFTIENYQSHPSIKAPLSN